MDLSKVAALTEEQLDVVVGRAHKTLQTKNRGREFVDAVRQLFGLWTLRSKDFDFPSDLIAKLFSILEEEGVSLKVKHLAAYLVWKSLPGDIVLLKENLRQHDKRFLLALLPLMMPAGGYAGLKANLQPLVQWYTTQEYSLRGVTVPMLMSVVRHHPFLLVRYLRALEGQMIEWLTNASTYAIKPAGSSSGGMSNLFGGSKANAKPSPVAEWDGSPCRDFFTVLNVTQVYSVDQVMNLTTFSTLFTWIYELYFNPAPRYPPQEEADDDLAGPTFPLTMDARFSDAILRYCSRIIDQSKLTVPSAESRVRRLPDLALYEALRLLDALSFFDPELVKKMFNSIKKLYVLGRSAWNKRSNCYIFLEILEYFMHHGEVVLYDPDPLLRQYFDTFLNENFMDQIIALETLWFCQKMKAPLVQATNVMTLYFHSLLKIAAWHPVETSYEINSLVPAFASPTTYLELFHSLIDLPLLAAALEKMEAERDSRHINQPSPSSMSSNGIRELMSDKYGVLFHLLLRKESGVVINFWDSTQTLSLLRDFCKEVDITPRIAALADTVPTFLETFFDVVIEYADEKVLLQLTPVIFERMDQLFPFPEFESRVRRVMIKKVLEIFQKYPSFIVQLKELILEVIRDSHTPSREELVLSLCWAAGEHASLNLTPMCTVQTLDDYDEALELFAFERMVLASETATSPAAAQYNTRLMLVVISSLTKLASRWQPLSSRVVLCLAKLLRQKKILHPTVVERAYHCLALLRYPSIAASILDSPMPTEIPSHHIDANSSLPFLLRPVSTLGNGKISKIHPFM